MIGDGESAALVSRSGSIDWMCWPRFDSDACLAALVGGDQNGYWALAPSASSVAVQHRYCHDTLIVERDFSADTGAVRVIDFMPIREGAPTLIRYVQGLRGTVPMTMQLKLRFGYGFVPPWIEVHDDHMVAHVGPDLLVLYADVLLRRNQEDVSAEFLMHEGEHRSFVLRFAEATGAVPGSVDWQEALPKTEAFWRSWIGQFQKPTRWPEAVRRSLITLKALIDQRTGGIVAAPTISSPEVPGGAMNWDYRYCWLRDAAFTISALLNAGYHDEARAWRDWVLRTIAGTPEHVQVIYRLDGARHLDEWTVPGLGGYRWSPPVRVGNSAAKQAQLDIYGELIDTMHLASRAGIEMTPQAIAVEQALVKHVEAIWEEPGHGMWERRGEARHFVYAKVMAWVAVDRVLKRPACTHDSDSDSIKRLSRLRAEIHRQVCTEGFHSGLDSFVQFYGSTEVDGSLSLIPLLGFLPIDDARVASTIARIERELMEDGLVYRSLQSKQQTRAAFLACSCWLADCRQMQGRTTSHRQLPASTHPFGSGDRWTRVVRTCAAVRGALTTVGTKIQLAESADENRRINIPAPCDRQPLRIRLIMRLKRVRKSATHPCA